MSLLPFAAQAGEETIWGFGEERVEYFGQLWKSPLAGDGENAYRKPVEALLEAFEKQTGRRLVPGQSGKAALKVYTNSGSGLATPKGLVREVIRGLLERGFRREDLCIVDARESLLRNAGFLPPLSRIEATGPYFEGVRVHAIDTGELKSSTWFYESPLPQEFTSPLGRIMLQAPIDLDPQEARKSYLPENLLTGVDFWINLPVACHHPATGISGALVNASLWNIDNGMRFFNSPANAPVAVAEIASIPELKARWALNIVSLESYQFIAGPGFNANYTGTLPEVWMSIDPVIMDVNLIQIMNKDRIRNGFQPFPPVPEFIEYSAQLGLGNPLFIETEVFQVPAGNDD